MEKIGIVFAGGNGNSAYQFGAWKALRSYEVESSVRVVSGTSFGALNAVMFASDGYEKAEAMWQNAAKLKISNVPITKLKEIYDILLTSGLSGVSFEQFLALFGHGLFAEKSFSEFLDEHIDLSKMRESIEHIFIGATRFPTVVPVYYDLLRYPEKMRRVLLTATNALPILYSQLRFSTGVVLWEGSFTDLSPLLPVYEAGARVIFVLHLSQRSTVQQNLYPDAKIYELFPRPDFSDRPGCVDFTRLSVEKRMKEGYGDMVELIQKLMKEGVVSCPIGEKIKGVKAQEKDFLKQTKRAKNREAEEKRREIVNLLTEK